MSVVTVSYQLGSQGAEIGQALAERLGYRCIGSDVMGEAAARYGVAADKLTQLGEAKPSFFERLSTETRLYIAVIQTIVLDHAEQDSVVLLGRGGQWLLRGVPHALRVRVVAPFALRVKRVGARLAAQALPPDSPAVAELVRRDDTDKAGRARFLYDIDIDDPALYSVVLNTEALEVSGAVEALGALLRQPELATTPASARLVADRALASRVHAALAGEAELRGFQTDVTARDGVVRLETSGPVEQVSEVARRVPGVREVAAEPTPILPLPPIVM